MRNGSNFTGPSTSWLNRPRYISEAGHAFKFTSHFIAHTTTKVSFKHFPPFHNPPRPPAVKT